MRQLRTDYLVVGAGAMGMAFVDSLIDHADVHVTLVDRRDGPGGHWRDAYPFVRLHQASLFYGVASTQLGEGSTQADGPEAGLHERADLTQILDYYDRVLERMTQSGQVTFLGGADHRLDGSTHLVIDRQTDEQVEVVVDRRFVDATYLSPSIPATSRLPYDVDAEAAPDAIPVNAIVEARSADEYVIVGSGKTATDAIVWLLGQHVDPDRIVWIRPRDPWMLNRARVQPDPVVALELAGDIAEAASEASDHDDLFARLEDANVVMRVDPDHTPTMARTPTLGRWELELLQQVDRVVRMGRLRRVTRTELVLDQGTVQRATNSLVVHCAASGTINPPMVPIWGPDAVRLQTTRAGAPCFNAALLGLVEATRPDDIERNRLCPPNLYGNTRAQWAAMTARGAIASRRLGAEPDLAAWANACLLNPARIDASLAEEPDVLAAQDRLARLSAPSLQSLVALSEGLADSALA